MVTFPGFIGPAYQSKSWKASAQRCVNLYLEPDPEKGAVLFGTPGTVLRSSLPDGQVPLAALETPNCLVVGATSSITTYTGLAAGVLVSGSITGAISPSQFVSLAQAGSFVMATNGTNGYAFDRTNPLDTPTLIVSPGFPANPQYVTALDGRFIVNQADSDTFNWSDPFDPFAWNALEFASAESLNDKLVRPIAMQKELYLIGQQSTEIWAGVESVDVFAPIQGTYIPYGTLAAETVATIGQSLIWLSRDQNGQGLIVRVKGLQVQRISTHAIEEELATYSTLLDAYAWVYQQTGHEFYVISFPTALKTWVFDLSTNLWHERASTVPVPGSGNPETKRQEHHVGRCHAYFQGLNIIGSRLSNGDIYSLDQGVYVEATGGFASSNFELLRTRTSPHVFANGDYNSLHRVEFGLQPGVGLNITDLAVQNASDADPQAMCRVSKDGSRTWGSQRFTSMGALGKYKTRIGFNRFGRARDFVAELTISARVPVALTSAQFSASP